MTIKDLNCSTCPDGFPCGITGVRLAFIKKSSALRILTETSGCIYHPRMKEWIMQDELKELERLKEGHRVNCFDYGMSKEQHEDNGQYLAYNHAINIIKNGVEK
jgi:hypothetical protein